MNTGEESETGGVLKRDFKASRSLVVILLYINAGLAAYLLVIVYGIFVFDDFEYVVGNPLIQELSCLKGFASPRYIGYLTFALNYALGGEDPFGYHLFNVLVHILNACLVFFLLRVLLEILSAGKEELRSRHERIAALSGLLFLLHPVETQAVSYITQRFTSLSALFYLLSLLLYLSARRGLEKNDSSRNAYAWYALSLTAGACAMKTKEIAFTLPLIAGVMEFLLFRASRFGKRRFVFLVPFAALLVLIPLSLFGPALGLAGPGLGVDEMTRRDKLFDLFNRSAADYLFTQFRVIVVYLRLLIFPVGQRVIYDLRASHSFFEMEVLISFLILEVFGMGARYFWKKADRVPAEEAPGYRLLSLGIIWFFITLTVESSFIPIKDMIFEHRIYLPSVGFLAACAVMLLDGAGKIFKRCDAAVVAWVLAAVLAVPLCVGTYRRNKVWTDELVFWDDIVKKTGKAIGYNNRASAYAKAGMYKQALQDLDRTISFFSRANDEMAWENADFTRNNMAKTFMTRSLIYKTLGDEEHARADFERAKQLAE